MVFVIFFLTLMSSSENTISWSDIPGMVSTLVNLDGLLVITRSRVFSPRVGSSTIWTSPLSSKMFVNL